MSDLVKAELGEITSGDNPTEVPNTSIRVQFNPTTLRVQISNRTAGGQQAGAQARQRPGTGEMQVSFDLVFDTADEAKNSQGEAVNVLDKTKMVERFVRPKSARAGDEAPPRVVFKWGSFLVQGTMESANIDLDLFDAQGIPLRAKVAVTIKGQDPRWIYTPAPTPQSPGNTSSSSGGRGTSLPPGTPGTQGNNAAPERIVQAMPGESLAQLAQRAGLDPNGWRALADGVANPLKLELGQEIPLPSSTTKGSASAAQSQDPGKAAASLPLVNANEAPAAGNGSNDASRNNRDVATDPVRKGQAMTARGGVQGAIASIKSDAHQQGAGNSLRGFGLGGGDTADTDARPWGAGVPLRPRFGASKGALRRDPTQAGWLATPLASTTATAPPGGLASQTASSSKTSAGRDCGCRGSKSRSTK
jgi:LysM repeat protein